MEEEKKKGIAKAKTLGTAEVKKTKAVDSESSELGIKEDVFKKKKGGKLQSTFLKLAPAIIGALTGNSDAVNTSAQMFANDAQKEALLEAANAKTLAEKRAAAQEDAKEDREERKIKVSERKEARESLNTSSIIEDRNLDNTREDIRTENTQFNADRSAGQQDTRIGLEQSREGRAVVNDAFGQKVDIATLNNSAKALEIQQQNTLLRKQEIDIKKSNATQAQKDKKLAAIEKKKKENKELEIPGVGIALTKQDAKEGKEIFAASKDALSAVDDISKLREQFNEFGEGEFINRDAVAKGKALAARLQLIIKSEEFTKLGVLTGPDVGLLEKLVPPNPLAVDVTGSTKARLKEAEELIVSKAKAFYEARGLESPFKTSEQSKLDAKKAQDDAIAEEIKRRGL